MGDVVIRLPVHDGEEAQLFGSFLNSFIEGCGTRAEVWAGSSDAPYLMVQSDPQRDVEMKVLTFQEQDAAQDFSRGWDEARTGLTAKVTYLFG